MNSTTRKVAALLAIATTGALLAACGKEAASTSSGADTAKAPDTSALATSTPAPTGTAGDLVWQTYRETNSLDPIYAFDYPENTAISLMCESLLHQNADGTITTDGVASSVDTTDPLNMVITVRDGVKFWDGKPVTADDVVYSLGRARDAKLGGFYSGAFARVTDIKATAANEVTITLSQPDVWLPGELSSMPGVVYQQAFAEQAKADFGTVKGGTMCTGAYKLDSWKTGEGVRAVPSAYYWAQTGQLAASVTLKGVSDDAAFTAGMMSGDLSGAYPLNGSTLNQLKSATDAVSVTEGPSYAIDAFIVSDGKGTLGDPKVRQALSMALDRDGVLATNYAGAGSAARSLANPGLWGYSPETFKAAYEQLPSPKVDIEGAKALVKEAGAEGKLVRIGMSSELVTNATEAKALQSAALAIGLKAELVSVSAANYINFFIDAEARKTVDGFFTINYPDYADPAALFATLALPGGSQNYLEYENPQVTSLMEEARSEPDATKRAELVTQVQAILAQDLPWIPVVTPNTILVMNAKVTGAPPTFQYMFAPWANDLGTQ